MNVTIDKEFRTLIPPLSEEEFNLLESNCIENGIQDSLKTWNGILIDGHNRYEIAQKHGLGFKTEEMEFSSRTDVKLWIIKNQLGRRNLSAYDRSVLALKLKPVIAERAKENLHLSEGKGCQKSDKVNAIDTKKELAKVAGVSHDTIHKVETIEKSGNEEVKQAVRNKEMSIDKAYRDVKGLPPKKKSLPQTEVRDVEITVTNEEVMKNPIQAKEVEIEANIINKPVEEEPLPFEEITKDVSEELAHTFDVFDAAPVAELGRVLETLLDLKENEDSLIDGIKKAKTGSEKEEFRKQLADCGKFLAHIETMLIGW